jgi:hypothetical protein
MDEVELLKALGDVWDDATEIIESMHALRKKIVALHADAEGDDELADIYKLVHNQVDAVMASLRLTQARVESSVHASISTSSTVQPEKSDDAQTAPPEKSDDAQTAPLETSDEAQNSVVSEGVNTLDQTAANQDELREVAAAG